MSWRFDEFVSEVSKMIEGGATDAQVRAFMQAVPEADRDRVLAEARRRAVPADEAGAGVDHVGSVEKQVGDTTGPGAGYNDEPAQVKDEGGVV